MIAHRHYFIYIVELSTRYTYSRSTLPAVQTQSFRLSELKIRIEVFLELVARLKLDEQRPLRR